MEIHGWVATGKHGMLLASFREHRDEANDAARQVLRLLGGPALVAGFTLAKATLVVHDEAGPAGERVDLETS